MEIKIVFAKNKDSTEEVDYSESTSVSKTDL